MINKHTIFYKIFQLDTKKKIQECRPFIKEGSRILDVGCGTGLTDKLFQDFFKAEVMGVDVKDCRIDQIPFKIIDGRTLPFEDNYFDAALISFVLHHANDPSALLKESKRVAGLVIVYEDIPDNFLSKLICSIHIFLWNKFKSHSSNSNLSSFKKGEEWERIFNSLGFSIIFKRNIRRFWPLKQMQFVLKSD